MAKAPVSGRESSASEPPSPSTPSSNPATPSPASEPESKQSWNFKREGNPALVVSIISLLVTLAVAGYNLVGWITGPQVTFYPPELVAFHCSEAPGASADSIAKLSSEARGELSSQPQECTSDSYVFLRATSMTFSNEGQAPYVGVVRSEHVTAHFGNVRNALFYWQYFPNVTPNSSGAGKNAAAMLVPGLSAVGQETDFYPRDCQEKCDVQRDYVKWSDFEKYLNDDLNLVITIEFYNSVQEHGMETLTASCSVFIGERDRKKVKDLAMLKTSITQLNCAPAV